MGTITDRFHEENYTIKKKWLKASSKYLVEIDRTGEILVVKVDDCHIYIQKTFQDTVSWVETDEKCTIIKNLDGII